MDVTNLNVEVLGKSYNFQSDASPVLMQVCKSSHRSQNILICDFFGGCFILVDLFFVLLLL